MKIPKTAAAIMPPNTGISFKGVNLGAWGSLFTAQQREAFIGEALEMARSSPQLFEFAASYPLAEFVKAIEHVERAERSGTVLLMSQG